ncbi:MAG: GntR family transcriptional regulator [Proteobacteria bacterium]|jgi:GntR family transcriptional regulator|nr:GntR family transcriptional regulator [Pseudomonadota bacterium]
MHPLLDQSPIPRYLQLADLFRQRIARGTWHEGTRLPSLDELVREFGVARVTVRQAMELLTRDGLVSPQQGRGTFVLARSSPDRWLRLQTTLDDLAEVYRDTQPQILNISESSATPRLDARDGRAAPAYSYMRRLHSQDGRPYVVIAIHLDERIFRRAPVKFRRNTVIPLLLDMPEVTIARARQTLTIGTADVEIARLLKIPVNAPVAEVRRVFNAPDETVIYLAEAVYRGDFIHFDMDLRPQRYKEGRRPRRLRASLPSGHR